MVNATVEWLFWPSRTGLSVTISAPDRLIDAEREALARHLWAESRP